VRASEQKQHVAHVVSELPRLDLLLSGMLEPEPALVDGPLRAIMLASLSDSRAPLL
jgi:hypothetical protein